MGTWRLSLSIGFVAFAVIGPAQLLFAQTQTGPLPVLPKEPGVEHVIEIVPPKPPASPGKDGFIVKSADGASQLKLRGLIQTDGRFFFDDENPELVDTFLLRRVRPIFEGTLLKCYDFRIMPDFGEGKTVLQDAYIDVKHWPEAKLRVGKFKTPFGLERLQSASDIEFVERALPNNLVPNRDIGVQLHGELYEGLFNYAVGIFNGVPDGGSADFDNHDDKDLAARVFAHPFKHACCEYLEGLGVGMAATFGNQQGTTTASNLPAFKSAGQQTFFSYRTGAFADGERFRLSPQAYYYWGSFGLLTEYVSSEQDVELGVDARTIRNDAWQVAVYWVLTGEEASYKGVTPCQPFDPKCGQWGAWELVARYSELTIDAGAFPVFADPAKSAEAARAWSLGLNWYWNRNVKVVFDYEQTAFDGGATGADREDEKAFFTRLQIAF